MCTPVRNICFMLCLYVLSFWFKNVWSSVFSVTETFYVVLFFFHVFIWNTYHSIDLLKRLVAAVNNRRFYSHNARYMFGKEMRKYLDFSFFTYKAKTCYGKTIPSIYVDMFMWVYISFPQDLFCCTVV